VLAFLLNFVPTIGSIIAAVPPVVLALVQLGLPEAGLAAAGFMAVNIGIGNFVEPRVMGRGLGISTLAVFVSLLFWGWLFGLVGMFLAVPLTAALIAALDASPPRVRSRSCWGRRRGLDSANQRQRRSLVPRVTITRVSVGRQPLARRQRETRSLRLRWLIACSAAAPCYHACPATTHKGRRPRRPIGSSIPPGKPTGCPRRRRRAA
jgi:hypothetical protein